MAISIRQLFAHTTVLVGCWLAVAAGEQQDPPELVRRLRNDPSLLRQKSVLRSLRELDAETYAPDMRRIAVDRSLAWDLRGRAVTLLDLERDRGVFEYFARDFDPLEVAGDERGAEVFNLLAVYLDRIPSQGEPISSLLLPGDGMAGVDAVLHAIAGQGVHDYLDFLYDRGYALQPAAIEALAETDDQLTRQLLCWYVGNRRIRGMESFLVGQIDSSRPSNYGSGVDRVFLAVFTVGIGEIIRSAVPKPAWLLDDATPKGLALEALGKLHPAPARLPEPAWVDRLVAAAEADASGKKRGQWQLSIDILRFLHRHREPLAGRADAAIAGLVRQPLRKRGSLQAFVAGEEICRTADLPFPALADQEKASLWDVAETTLDAAYIVAVARSVPDDQRRSALERSLLNQGEQAARGTLRVVRCWGADIETPGDWALVVAGLDLAEAVPQVEKVLDTSWTDEAVAALVIFGDQGAPVLARFLQTPAASRLETELKVDAIRACSRYLPIIEWSSLKQHLQDDRYLSEALSLVLAEGSLTID